VGERFSVSIQTGPWAHPASCAVDKVSVLGIKWPEHGINHPPPSSAMVRERIELYIILLWAFMTY